MSAPSPTPASTPAVSTPATFSLTTFILSHLVWIIALSIAIGVGHIALQEHDARVLAEAQAKTAEAAISTLENQIAATNAAAAQKVQTVVKIVHDVQTPAQAVAAIPQLSDAPLNARIAVDNPNQVSVDALAFIQVLGQAKIDATNLGACQANLKAETEIVAQKNTEIAALKKKPRFLHRVATTLKTVAIGIGIGAVIGAHL